MPQTVDSQAFDCATAPIFQLFTTDQLKRVLDFRATPELQERIEWLASRANEGELATQELAEYEGYVHANQFLAVLQAEARKRMPPLTRI